VIDGTVTLAGEQGGRQSPAAGLAVLLSGLPVKVPGVSLNRMLRLKPAGVHFAAQAVAGRRHELRDRLRRGEHDPRACFSISVWAGPSAASKC